MITPPTNTSNSTNVTISDYFETYTGAYGAIVGVIGGFVLILLGLSCIDRTNWENERPNIA